MADLENKGPMFVMRHRANSMITSVSQPDDVWFVDSGASNHMTSHQEWFMNLREPERPGVVETGDDSTHMIEHIGDVALSNHDNKGYMKDVMHVPTITKNLVSVGQFVEQGMQVRFNQEGCFIEDKGQLIAHARREGRMFILDATEVNTAMYAKGLKAESDIELWHKRVGHVNLGKLRSMQTKGAVHGLPRFTSKHPDNVCEACQLGKQHRHPFLSERNVSKGLLDVIHSDVWGPAQTATIGGCRYFVTFIDDYSRHTWICPMKSKSEVFSHFLKLKNRVENETNRKIRCLRSDGGQEYFSTEFKAFLEEKGIRREFSCRYTPQQNGVAERKNRTILEMARTMLQEKNMPHIYWAEAAVTAVYLINRCTTEGVHDSTPHEKYFGTKPDLSHLKVFGSISFVHVPDEKRRKLDPKSEKMILVGYSLEQKGYKCFNPVTRQSQVSRDVVFDEVASWYGPTSVTPVVFETSRSGADSESEEEEMLTTIMNGEPAESLSALQLTGPEVSSSNQSLARHEETSDVVSPWCYTRRKKKKGKMPEQEAKDTTSCEDSDHSPRSVDSKYEMKKATEVTKAKLRQSNRQKNPIVRFGYNEYMAHHYAFMMKVAADQEPETYKEAAQDPRWIEAMREEMRALFDNDTWDLVPSSEIKKKPIGCRWVFKIKHNTDGTVNRFKARLVAKGYAQTHGIDYEETFAPVAKMTTVRTVIALAAAKGWHLHQMDVKNAFLQGELEEEVYMMQPPGFESSKHPHAVCRLKKPLYGLKQAPRAWHSKITSYLHDIGFRMSKSDNSLYIRNNPKSPVFLILYVDDLVIGGESLTETQKIKKLLLEKFEMKDLNDLHYFLGIEVIQTPEGFLLSQRHYVLNLLYKFGMTECKSISTPLDRNMKLTADSGKFCEPTQYRQIIGSLIYLTITRPDLSYPVGLLSQFMETPRDTHMDCAKRVLRYVSGTLDYGIFYKQGVPLRLEGFTDADWAGNASDRRSTSGFMFSLGSGAISWISKKQPTVALSSTEAEYRAAAVAACEAVWLKRLLKDFNELVNKPILIHCDNLSSIQLAKNPVFHARTKHIEVHYHYIRERVLAGDIDLQYVGTSVQVADIFTKALGLDKLRQFSVDLGLRPLDMLSLGGSTSTKAKENMENQHHTRGRVRPASAK